MTFETADLSSLLRLKATVKSSPSAPNSEFNTKAFMSTAAVCNGMYK